MITSHKIILMLIAYSCLSSNVVAQRVFPGPSANQPSHEAAHTKHFGETVVPITSLKMTTPSLKMGMSGKVGPNPGIDATFGTGFCLDAACTFIATNYHVAVTARPNKIEREKIVQQYLATGPDDEGATSNYIPNLGAFSYA